MGVGSVVREAETEGLAVKEVVSEEAEVHEEVQGRIDVLRPEERKLFQRVSGKFVC